MTDEQKNDTPETNESNEQPETGGDASESGPTQEDIASSESPAAAAAAAPPAPAPTPSKPITPPPDGHWWWGTGRRKSAVARVRIKPGDGKFFVKKRPLEEYFNEERDRNDITEVLNSTGTKGQVDVHVNVHGGGFTGQAGAIVLGLARALRRYDQALEPILRDRDFLTRDARKVERKKYGQPGARKQFQFSKR